MSEPNGSDFPEITHPKKRAFLAAYAGLGAVTKAAKVAGICRKTHNNWKNAEGEEGDAYRHAFEEAHEHACEALEIEARRRAVHGTDKPVYQGGRKVGTVREYSDTLLIFLMKGAMPQKYKERQAVEHTGRDGGPIRIAAETLTDDELAGIAARGRRGIAQAPRGKNGTS
jgi:hypothetical protein